MIAPSTWARFLALVIGIHFLFQAHHLKYQEEKVLIVAGRASVIGPVQAALEKFELSLQSRGDRLQLKLAEEEEADLHKIDKECLDGTTLCDVIMVDEPWLPEFSKSKIGLMPLSLSEERSFVENTLAPARVPCPGGGGNCYLGVPYVGNSQILAYNKTLVNEPPPDWQGVTALLGRLRPGRPGFVLRGGDDSSVTDDFMEIYWSCGKDIQSALTTIQALAQFNPPQFLAFASFEVGGLLLKEHSTMGMMWAQAAMTASREDADEAKNLAFAQVPGSTPELGVWYLSIPVNAPHPNTASEFLRSATSRQAFIEAAKLGNPPPRDDVLQDKSLQELFPSLSAQAKSLHAAVARPHCVEWITVEQTIASTIRSLQLGDIGLPAAVVNIERPLRQCENGRKVD